MHDAGLLYSCLKVKESEYCTCSQCRDVEGLFSHFHIDKDCTHDLEMIEGSLEVKLPTVWTDEAAQIGRGRLEEAQSQVGTG